MGKKLEQVELHWQDKHVDPMAGTDDECQLATHPLKGQLKPRSLKEVGRFPGTTSAENLLICGDSLVALQHLTTSPPHAGQVKLCYLDPPFNTGGSFTHYNDALDTSVWLTMMRERLMEVAGLLAPDGSLWLHLDDRTQHYGRCLLDEVFGSDAFVATVIWQKRTTRDNRKSFSSMHDYIHVYAPSGPVRWKRIRNPLPDDGPFANPDSDPRGPWRSVPMTAPAGHATKGQYYLVTSPAGEVHKPPPGRCWTYTKERFCELDADGRVYWPRAGHGKPRLKRYRHEIRGLTPFTIWSAGEVGENAHAKKDLLRLFPGQPVFDTPKPERLLERIVEIATHPGELVLDYFLGSGTTAAVSQKLGRRWIGVERSADIVHQVAVPRLRRVLAGTDGIGIASRIGQDSAHGFRILEAVTHAAEKRVARSAS